MIASWFLAAAIGSGATSVPYADPPGRCIIVAQSARFDRVLQVDEFRIRYTLSGPDALSNRADINQNDVPDVIDDLAAQLITARTLYSEALGLRHPLHQPRYRLARAIDVLVRQMSTNGLAYDEVNRAPSSQSDCVLTIALSSDLRFDRNLSPAHELFHLYQYGYTMFKRAWYLEGMARWMESAFVASTPHLASDPRRPACEELASRSYEAADYWHALASQSATVRYPASLRSRVYTDSRPVIAVPDFTGGGAVRPILEALENASIAAAGREGVRIYAVPEAIQRSARFDATICRVVEGVAQNPDIGAPPSRDD